MTASNGAALSEIRRLFGAEFVSPSGAMDREKMRSRVFADPAAKQVLERLLHPMIREESARRIAAARGAYVIHVVPLLIESPDYRRRVDRVLVIDCPEETQLARVRQRSRLADDEIRAIMHTQVSRAERLAAADDVIDNRGDLDALRKQVTALDRKYRQYSKTSRA